MRIRVGVWWQKIKNTIPDLAAIATISMAITSCYSLHYARVERAEVNDLLEKSERQAISLNEAWSRISLSQDIAAAEGGDRFAYERAMRLLWERSGSNDGTAEALLQNLSYATKRFRVDAKDNPALSFAIFDPITENDVNVIRGMLQDNRSMARLIGLKHVSALRLNQLLPFVVQSLEKEPDLAVVQMAVQVINDAFQERQISDQFTAIWHFSTDDCVFHYGEFKSNFEQMWTECAKAMIDRPRKEVRRGRDKHPPHNELIYIYDPEKPDDIPVEQP